MGSSGKRALRLVLVLALTGCAPGGFGQPPGGASPSGSPLAGGIASPATAWPQARITTADLHLPGGMMFVEVEAAPGGTLFGFTFKPMPPGSATEPVGEVALLKPATHELLKVATISSPDSLILSGDASERWLVWAEASPRPTLDGWALYAQDRRTGQTRTVARAAAVDGRPVPTPSIELRLDGDMVVWSAGVARAAIGDHLDCFLAPLSGGQPVQTLATDCFHPVISWPYVVYGQHLGPIPGGYVELTAMDLRTHAHHPVGAVRSTEYYALAGTTLIYTTAGNKTIHLIDILSQKDRLLMDVTDSTPGYLQFPAINDRLAVWDDWAGVWAFDLKRKQLVRLRPATGFTGAYLRGSTLVWEDYTRPDSKDREFRVLRLLDTTQIP